MELFIENIVAQFGLSIVLLILFSKGLLIGKVLPAITTISTYAILMRFTDLQSIIFLCFVTAIATTLGEIIIFSYCKNPQHKLFKYLPDRIKSITHNDTNNKLDKLKDKLSNKYVSKLTNKSTDNIGIIIFIGNMTTGIRGFPAIIAGKSKYSLYRFMIISYLSTFIYHTTATYIVVTGFELIFV